jgi:ketosteroid isomerase-like protein
MSEVTAAGTLELVEGIYAAVKRQDWDSLLSAFDPDIVMFESEALPYAGTYRGLDEVSAALATVSQGMDLDSLEVEYVLADEEHAVGHIRVTLSGGLEVRISEHWTIRDGKVVELRPFYWDPSTITAAAA